MEISLYIHIMSGRQCLDNSCCRTSRIVGRFDYEVRYESRVEASVNGGEVSWYRILF
jgi:hypothetical protein